MEYRDHLTSLSPFLLYLAECQKKGGKVPSLSEISRNLGMNTASVREQLEVARAMGLVEVRPRTGIRPLPFSFRPAIEQSLRYRLVQDETEFERFAAVRNAVEAGFWHEAVSRLEEADIQELEDLVSAANEKIAHVPSIIPHAEHRQFHLTIFSRLDNIFVQGILETFWGMYESLGMALFADKNYLEQVWAYHRRMLDGIVSGDREAGRQALIDHVDLLHRRPSAAMNHQGNQINPGGV